MSSLWSMFAKGKIRLLADAFSDREAAIIVSELNRVRPRLVNISEIANHFAYPEGGYPDDYHLSLDATPCFPALWFEWLRGSDRNAISVMRFLPGHVEGAAHQVVFCMWAEIQGTAQLWGGGGIWVDRMGCPIAFSKERSTAGWAALELHDQTLAIEVLTTMNTRGTCIVPPLEKRVQIVKPDRAPCSVWHTIHLPKAPSLSLEGAETSDTMLERREHWVRAHRRDYRHGGGMFGRVKALVWVPEFQRGNPELGTVKQSYAVAQR